MLSDKILYVLAVGVLAAGVVHRYAGQGQECAQCALDRAQQIAHQVSARAGDYVIDSSPVVAGREARVNTRVQVVLARAQARVNRAQAVVDRRNAQIDRVNAAIARMNARVACSDSEGGRQ